MNGQVPLSTHHVIQALSTAFPGSAGWTVTPIRRGGNSRVVRAHSGTGMRVVLKRYAEPEPGGIDRLDREFTSLTFLHEAGIGCVPRPLARFADMRIGIYGCLDGHPVAAHRTGPSDILQLTAFLRTLNGIVRPGREVPPAAEACGSLTGLGKNIRSRLEVLDGMTGTDGAVVDEARRFVVNELRPCAAEALGRAHAAYRGAGMDPDAGLPAPLRIVSPSDFGFHNALRMADGTLSFVDFEYFGWDDPAKTTSDFILHPKERVGRENRRLFVSEMASLCGSDPAFRLRLRTLYPLFAVKWSIILLNEFIPSAMLRRELAGAGNRTDRLAVQLAKSRRMLRNAAGGAFPYDL